MANASLQRRGRKIFSFAVIADSHLEVPVAGGTPPRSNLRNRGVVDWLRPRSPSFALHLGDIVHPVPQARDHDPALELASTLYRQLECPVLYTPGNHDIGDKPSFTMPAATVTEGWLGGYQRVFGPPYAAHHFGECVVLLVNSPILNSGYRTETEQRSWLERELIEARGKRIFIGTHYPPYLVSPDEPAHYDNIDPPARYWLLDLLAQHRVEAVFCGHVHNFFYNRLGPTEIYALPSTSFVRRDYSELFRTDPADERGRNDIEKLGFFWVDVHERGHVARFVRTYGGGESLENLVIPGHPKDPDEAPLGVHLRHPWAELVELPYNPPVDEFARRAVRNDYFVQAIWDLGVRSLRAPIDDLWDPRVRARIGQMVDLGHRFTFFSLGCPDARLLDLLRTHARMIARWECVLPMRQASALAAQAGELLRTTNVRLAIANLRSAAEGNSGLPPGKHFAAGGFSVSEMRLATELATGPLQGLASAVCFRISRTEPIEPRLADLEDFRRATGLVPVATVALMPDGPNETAVDDAETDRRVSELLVLARRYPGVELFLDTFMDVDRGYYVRTGLIDRRCNLRRSGHTLLQFAAARAKLDAP